MITKQHMIVSIILDGWDPHPFLGHIRRLCWTLAIALLALSIFSFFGVMNTVLADGSRPVESIQSRSKS